MKDRQGEITIRDELLKVLPIWIARGGPITDTHSNRVVGKGINYAATTVTDAEGKTYPAITIQYAWWKKEFIVATVTPISLFMLSMIFLNCA